jgi:hypothetical protein
MRQIIENITEKYYFSKSKGARAPPRYTWIRPGHHRLETESMILHYVDFTWSTFGFFLEFNTVQGFALMW